MYWCVFYAPYLALNVTAKLHLLASIVSTHAWSVGERDRGGGLVQVFNCCSDEWRKAMFVLKKEAGSCGAYVLWNLVRSSWSHPHYPMHCQCEDTLSLARTKWFCNWHTLQESPNLRGPNITDPEGLGGYLHGDVWCTYGATVAVHDLTFQVQMHCLREVLQSFP